MSCTKKGTAYVRIHREIDKGCPSALEEVYLAQELPNFHEIFQSALSGDSLLDPDVLKCEQPQVLARAVG